MILQPYYSHITIILQLPYDLITTLSLKGEALYTTLIGRCPINCDKSVTYHSSNTVMPMKKPGEQRSLRKAVAETAWFYADLMKPPSVIPELEYLKPEEWQKKLEKSEHTFTARKSNDIVKNITTVRNSQYLQCTEKDVEVGTMETAAFKLLNSLYRVSDPFAFRVETRPSH